MPQSNEGLLLLIGALFLLLGLLGGGFEISSIKLPPVGKFTRGFALVIGVMVFGLGLLRLASPVPAIATPTAPSPTVTLTTVPPSPVPPSPVPPSPIPSPQASAPTQPAPIVLPEITALPINAKIHDVSLAYNVIRFEKKGMLIHVKFSISGMQAQEGHATAYFYDQDGNPLMDQNGAYAASDGAVAVDVLFTPSYPITQYDDLELFLPYDELELDAGTYNLKLHVEIWESAHPENPALAVSPEINFYLEK